MEFNQVKALVFSGTGNTMRAAERLCESLGGPATVVDVTPRDCEVPPPAPGDLYVLAVPSYGGRVPEPFLERLSRLGDPAGDPIPAIMLVSYGNRAVDDTFVELADAAREHGLVPVAGAAVVAQHSLMTSVATDRPDASDLEVVERLAREAVERLGSAGSVGEAELGAVPGDRPYREYDGVPFKATTKKDLCVKCGACASKCPTGAIDRDHPELTQADCCISCMRCVAACPRGARRASGGPALWVARKVFARKCADRRDSYLI